MSYKQDKNMYNLRKLTLMALAGAQVVGFACVMIGIILVVISSNKQPEKLPATSSWSYSEEGKRVGLEKLFLKVQTQYFELYPNRIAFKPDVTANEVKHKFKPYDPKPHLMKQTTDASRKLMKELDNLQVSTEKLKQFEKRAIAQVKYWVHHVFSYGVPYGYDYYTGDWLLGPDIFSWSPICQSLWELQATFQKFFKPLTIKDLELVKVKLQEAGQGFQTTVDNWRLGVDAGMVRNVEACEGGWNSFTSTFRTVQVHGEQGIVNNSDIKPLVHGDFLSKMKPDETKKWKDKHGKTVKESLQELLVVYLGRPIHQMLRYLESNYSKHCVSSDISSGLSSLPLRYVYVNNKPTVRTTGQLPTGEPLNGKKAYDKFLSYWTTTEVTADELYKLGSDLTTKLHDELLHLARQITGEKDNDRAKASIQAKMDEASNYFNTQPIPAGESNKEAYSKCISMETAKVHCPVRWQAMQNWFAFVKQLSSDLRYKVMNLFHFVGPKATVPNCPVEPRANFNPAISAASYGITDADCSRSARYFIPFFLKQMGPNSEEWTVSAHEMIPGHHLQIQGYAELFSNEDKGVAKWLSTNIYFLPFAEGWALYGENPLIANETDAYKDLPLMKFSTLNWQLVPALSLMVDIGLHSKNMSRDQALEIMSKYVWVNKNRLGKQLTRYQSIPAQSISYMIGRLEILKIRGNIKKKLGKKFNIKDFHYQLLRQGSSPLSYLDKAMDKYASCELNNDEAGCDEVLSPPTRYTSGSNNIQSNELDKIQRILRPSFFRTPY